MRIRPLWGFTSLFASPLALRAQAPPLSSEFIVNSFTTGGQSAPDGPDDGTAVLLRRRQR